MFDLTLVPYHIVDGQDQPQLPGIFSAAAPRRAARGRASDLLVLLFTLSGNAPLPSENFDKLVERMGSTYFNTAGSVTSALRAAADSANQTLLERNLRNSSSGRQSIGLLNIALFHGDTLYLAHAGPVHTLIFQKGAWQHYHDPQVGGKGLGMSRTTVLRYYQVECSPEMQVYLSPEANTPSLAHRLSGQPSLNPTDLRRLALASQPGLRAVLVQAQPGSGKISSQPLPAAERTLPVLSGAPISLTSEALETPVLHPGDNLPVADPDRATTDVPQETEESPTSPTRPEAGIPSPPSIPLRENVERPRRGSRSVEKSEPARGRSSRASRRGTAPPPANPSPSKSSSRPPGRAPEVIPADISLKEPIAQPESRSIPVESRTSEPKPALHLQSPINNQQFKNGLASLITRVLPGRSEEPQAIPSLTMGFVAIAVPVLVVVVAMVVYLERGRGQQYQTYYQQAVQAAALAQYQTDPGVLRNVWSQTLYWLDKAEASRPDQPDAAVLRSQAQGSLDQIESITRLDFQPAILGGLGTEVNVTQMVATSTDLYMLNSGQGQVMRAILTGRGFEVDPDFHCEPGPSGSYIIGPLVDMVSMPKGNEFNATLLAIDGTGNVVFCVPGGAPTSVPLGPPDNNWGKIAAIIYEAGTLYVLDPPNNAVWIYGGTSSFRDRPSMYFGGEIPYLADAVDLAINGDDLFLLHSDGHLTQCTASYVGGYSTRCIDPAPYADPRPGREANPAVLAETRFNQMRYTQPPDPSLYFLDPASASIYHFSLRLNLQRQLRGPSGPSSLLPSTPATAFAVGPNRMAFLAFGNQVVYGLIP